MKNGKIRDFLQHTVIKVGVIAAASAFVLTSGSWSGILRGGTQVVSEADLPVFTDPEDSHTVQDSETPLPPAPKITRTSNTKKTVKKIKMGEKSKKTYTKKGSPQKRTVTSRKYTGGETTTITTETTTTLTSKFTKGSRINKQTTTVTTVITTIVQANETPNEGSQVISADAAQSPAAQTTASNQMSGQVSVSSIAPRIDSRVSNAYTKLGFTVNVNPAVSYSGVFDARSRSITLKNSGDTVYHELGHFLAFAAGNVDKSSSFQQIFEQEKNRYTLYNRAYVLQNSSEYFAESFKNYTLNSSALRAERPLTCAAIESALGSITDSQLTKIQTVYRAVWGA